MPDPHREHRPQHEDEPARVRVAILSEHVKLRRLLRGVEREAHKLMASATPREAERVATFEAAQLLCSAMTAHIDLESRVLAPALETLDAWGKVRADRLRREHEDQRLILRSYLAALQALGQVEPGQLLADVAQRLVDTLRKDMEIEEQTLLAPELWRGGPTGLEVEAG